MNGLVRRSIKFSFLILKLFDLLTSFLKSLLKLSFDFFGPLVLFFLLLSEISEQIFSSLRCEFFESFHIKQLVAMKFWSFR